MAEIGNDEIVESNVNLRFTSTPNFKLNCYFVLSTVGPDIARVVPGSACEDPGRYLAFTWR